MFVERVPAIEVNKISKLMKKETISFWKAIKRIYGFHQAVLDEDFDEINIQYTRTDLTFGKRIWMKCPSCDERVGKLFIYKGKVKCRSCHKLKYMSQQFHRDFVYETFSKYKVKYDKLEIELCTGKKSTRKKEQIKREMKKLEPFIDNGLKNLKLYFNARTAAGEGKLVELKSQLKGKNIE